MVIETGRPFMRQVPLPLFLQMLFDSSFSTFGWIFFGIGVIGALAFVSRCEVFTLWQFTGPLSRTSGVIERLRDDSGPSRGSALIRYAVAYSFTPAGSSQRMEGTAYAEYADDDKPAPGDKETVEYRPDHPQFSRVPGMRTAAIPTAGLLVLLFPAVGLVLMLVKIFKGLRGISLLQSGLPALGTLVAVEPTNTSINDARLYRMKFQFTAANGQQYTAKYLSTELKPAWRIFYHQANGQQNVQQSVEKMENVVAKVSWLLPSSVKNAVNNQIAELRAETPPALADLQETVLYHPAHPTRATLPMTFAAGISIDAHGNLQGVHPIRGILASIIPALVILAIAWFGRFVLPH